MKLPNHLNIARLTFVTILLIALSSGCFFAGKNWDSWFPEVVETSNNPESPKTETPPQGSGNVVENSDNNDRYTDLEYMDKSYRVEKSLLTEAGSKYNAIKRFYRFLNGNWEMKEVSADAKWKPATKADIPIILKNWDAKFKAKEAKNKGDLAQTNPLPPTPPVTPPTTPLLTSPPKNPKPPKTTPTEIPKVAPQTLNPAERYAKLKEIEKEVRSGKCDPDCIIYKVKEFQFSASQQRSLMSQIP